MSETSGKKKRRSRKTKEEKTLEKIAKEQNEENESVDNANDNSQRDFVQATPEQLQMMQTPNINKKMMDMDIRIKYGFIRTLHNNLISINRRFNWDPEELMAIGMIFRDFQSIELTVFNSVMQNEENDDDEEEGDEEEEVEEEQSEDIN
tara:strand:+ start:1202 stop:1648 length:447 start_codon:yes stop_codon:yes gene_type:complete